MPDFVILKPEGAPENYMELLAKKIEETTTGMDQKDKSTWWDCFVDCLARENPAVKTCAIACTTVCVANGPTPPCLNCILGCGGIAWSKIISCATTCTD